MQLYDIHEHNRGIMILKYNVVIPKIVKTMIRMNIKGAVQIVNKSLHRDW